MRKIAYILIAAAAAVCSASCMKIDNFDAPDAQVSGTIIDVTTGQPFLTDHGTNSIRIWEMSYSTNPTPQDLRIQEDGTYSNTKLFAGTYDMLPRNGAWWPTDTTYNVKIGAKGTVQNFEVTPYLHVQDFSVEMVPGTDSDYALVFKCRLQAPIREGLPQITEIRPFLSLNKHCGNGNHLDYYYSNTYRINLRQMFTNIDKDGDGVSDVEYTVTCPVKNGYKYWCRMGVKFNDTYESWNLSETKMVEIPQ